MNARTVETFGYRPTRKERSRALIFWVDTVIDLQSIGCIFVNTISDLSICKYIPNLSLSNWHKFGLEKISSPHLIMVGITVPVITLIIIGIQAYDSIAASQGQTTLVVRTHETINSLKDVLISLINAETGQRGYVITGNRSYLDPYNSAIADLGTKLSSLHESFSINATQVSELNQKLIPLINKRLSLLNSSIQARQNIGFSAASDIIASGQGKVVMDQIRKRINSMINLEEN